MRRSRSSARGTRGLWCTAVVVALVLGSSGRAAAAGAGYWHTSGNQILDANGQVVRIAGINWYGFETTDKVIHGLWCQDWHSIVNSIKALGYNVVRMPFSDDMISFPIDPTNIGASNGAGPMNRDVIGLDSLTIMDKVIQTLGDVGIRVILDNHRSNAGNSAQENGLWYTPAFSEATLIDNWVTLVRRYKDFRDPQGNPIVIGADLRNEPHLNVAGSPTGACWTGDTSAGAGGCPATSNRNWPEAAERIGNAILAENPNLLIIVEGAECYDGDCDWWGGNLQGVATNPVVLSVPNRIVYSAHDYGPNLFRQKWFTSSTTCDSLAAVWDKYWGYISARGIAPVLVGEFGANNGDYTGTSPGSQGQWFSCLVGYIKARPALHWTYWALNGEDDYALLGAQYDPVPPASGKQAMLAAMQFPLEGGGGLSCATPNIPQNFTATTISASRVDLRWNAVPQPGAGCAVTYDVFRSTNGTTMVASPETRIATGVTGTSYSDTTVAGSTTYYYLVEAVDITVASPPSSKTSATTPQGSGTTYVLTVTPSASGTVASTPGGIQCGATCSAAFAAGSVVTLTATSSSGAAFGGWSGACSGTAPTCTVTMSAAKAVTASFVPCAAPAFQLTVTKAGTGSGTVTSSPAGINCGTTCSMAISTCGPVPVIVLTATPSAGSAFTGWSGACSGTATTCSVALSAGVNVTASFTLATTYPLTVTRAGTGSGTVTSSAGGIDCGTACSASLPAGSVVTLTATAAAGMTFNGWSGACSGTARTCALTMVAARSVTATFSGCAANPYTTTVVKAGTGSGTVTSSPAGINCGTACSVTMSACGTAPLVLTATPAAGSAFTGWSGGCTGTATTCTAPAITSQVTATFTLATTYPLTVTRAGAGLGTVTSSVGGIDCGTACSATFASGTAVTLTAAAASGSAFDGWSGACVGTGPCVVTMTAARAVTATFTTASTPCANPTTFTSNTGNFNTTGAACYRTAQRVNGWGCSNFTGRTISVNGGTATGTCGAGPFPLAQVGGYTYFSATAGSFPWASIYVW